MIPGAAIWSGAHAGEALVALVDAAGFESRHAALGAPAGELASDAWLCDAASWLGVEARPVAAAFAEVPSLVRGCAPALIRVEGRGFLAVASVRGRELCALGPDGDRHRIPAADVVAALRAPAIASIAAELDAMMQAVAVPPRRRDRAHDALCAARLHDAPIQGVTMIRHSVDTPLRVHARNLRLAARLAAVAALHLAGYLASIASWWVLGRTFLSGRVDAGWLAAWAMLVATGLVGRTAASWAAGRLAIDAAGVLRLRLLAGALRLPADVVRGEGAGRSLGRVFESEAFESLAVTGGFAALFAAIELVIVLGVLGLGAGGFLHVALLAVTLAVAVLGWRRYHGARRAWTDERLAITHHLVDVMNGHATRLAQQPIAEHHVVEDQALVRYVRRSEQLDRSVAWIQTAIPRGWLVIASVGLAPTLIGGGVDVAPLAIAFGGMLLAYGALVQLGDAATRLSDAAIAWRAVAPLVTAGGTRLDVAPPSLAHGRPSPGQPLAVVRGLVYHAPRDPAPVLAGCDLQIREGDRVLLEGRSGAGKSTLASIIGGLRRPHAGLVLASGLDRAMLGESGWRRRIALVPQFHDNHIFFGPLAFNLLMARAWPPSPADLADARAVCVELGLGPTLDRMPAGLFELVGETGWRLSHGERSRVFLARALLSPAPLVVLDESLAALDPATLIDAIGCIERRARAALVIAHP
jgi:ATP-binding cassette subfamily B protein